MDAIDLVKKDHDRVEELFRRFKGGGGLTGLVRRATGTVPPRQRRTAVEGICRELDVHARIEEEILYPAIRSIHDADLDRMVKESLREHARVKRDVAALRRRSDGEGVEDRVAALEECVNHHVSEEENEMLPRVADLLDPAKREALGRRMQARKRALAAGRPATRAAAGRRAAARKTAGGGRRRRAG